MVSARKGELQSYLSPCLQILLHIIWGALENITCSILNIVCCESKRNGTWGTVNHELNKAGGFMPFGLLFNA